MHDSAAVGDSLGCLLMPAVLADNDGKVLSRRPVIQQLVQAAPNSAAVTGDDRMGITTGGVVTGTRGGTGGATVGTLHRWLHLAWCSLICCNRPRCRSTPSSVLGRADHLAGEAERGHHQEHCLRVACQVLGESKREEQQGRSRPQRGWRPTAQALQTASSASWPPAGAEG